MDTGPLPEREDACLRRFHITDVPLVVLTHFHEDHIGGLSGLLAGRKVAAIETTLVDDPAAGARQVRQEAAAAGVPVRRVVPFEHGTLGRVSWHALWPDPDELPAVLAPEGGGDGAQSPGEHGGGEGSGPNNSSIVLAVSIAAVAGIPAGPLTALLTGDIESPVQQLLLAGSHRDELRATVLKVPHHGYHYGHQTGYLLGYGTALWSICPDQ